MMLYLNVILAELSYLKKKATDQIWLAIIDIIWIKSLKYF
jgi:hypothetical protein